MMQGRILSANLGNFLPTTFKYTCSLADRTLANQIHLKILEINPDICLLQEIWNFSEELLGDSYENIGQNDCIAVKRTFGSIIPESFQSYAIRFKKSEEEEIYPDLKDQLALTEHKNKLQKDPYNGEKNSKYGIPADFDASSAIIIHHSTQIKILVVNVHVQSMPWKDKIRAYQLKNWVYEKAIQRAADLTEGRILIGGDFNHDEFRQKNGLSAQIIRNLENLPNIKNAGGCNQSITTNYPTILKNYRYDHLFGSAKFSNFKIQQSLRDKEMDDFRRNHRLTWWMHLDHKNLSANFIFIK